MSRLPHKNRPKAAQKVWTAAAVRALGVRTDVPTAAAVLGMSERTARDMVRRGDFPLPVLHLGRKQVVPCEPLLALLGLTPEKNAVGVPHTPTSATDVRQPTKAGDRNENTP